MSRRHSAEKRVVLPDAKYHDKVVAKFINNIMEDGKKAVAEKIVYSAFDILAKKSKQDPLVVFNEAIENVKPMLEVKSRRVGGSNVQVPLEVNDVRGQALSLRWLVNYAKLRSGKGMANNLAAEIMDAANGVGGAVKKREDTHKMAEANKAFAHYRY